MEIGRRSAVSDIRQLWPLETLFSDWLASTAGIELLGQDLGVEVENLQREVRCSDYPCDLVGNIVGDEEHVVIIENQYGKTDHDHLGKFLTYASTHRAMTCVWIAERVSDDHRAAVDWLNANTPEQFSFYAAELKAYCINESPAAPTLDVVCKPNVSVKPTRQGETGSERARHEWRRKFWEEIQDALRLGNPRYRLQKPSSDSWSSIALGSSDVHMSMLLTPSRNTIGVMTIIQGPNRNEWFSRFEARKEAIEATIGEVLNWEPLRGEKSASVWLEYVIDSKDDANRDAVKQWFCQIVPKWHQAFSSEVAAQRSSLLL